MKRSVKALGHRPFCRGHIWFVFIKNFQFFNGGIKSFEAIFGYEQLNAESIEGEDLCKRRISAERKLDKR